MFRLNFQANNLLNCCMLSTITYLERINELEVECEEISQRKSPHEIDAYLSLIPLGKNFTEGVLSPS